MRGGDDAAAPVGEEHRQAVGRQHRADVAGRARDRDVGFGCAARAATSALDDRACRAPARATAAHRAGSASSSARARRHPRGRARSRRRAPPTPLRVVENARTGAGAGQSGTIQSSPAETNCAASARVSAHRSRRARASVASSAAKSAGSGDSHCTGLVRRRMDETEAPARAAPAARTRCRARFAVRRIADQRMSERGQVHADLVRAAGLEPAAQQRAIAESLAHFVARDARLCRSRRPPSTCAGPDDGRSARRSTPPRDDVAGGERQIFAVDRASPAAGARDRFARFRSWRRPGGRSCPCRGDARCPRAATRGELRRVVQQRVGKRAVAVAAARDGRRGPAGLSITSDRRRPRTRSSSGNACGANGAAAGSDNGCTSDALAAADLAARVRRRAGERHAAGVDPGPEAAARMLGQQLRERLIEPHARDTSAGMRQRRDAASGRGWRAGL